VARELPSKEEMMVEIETHFADQIKQAKAGRKQMIDCLDKIRDIVDKVMPLLPDSWAVKFYPWGLLAFSNYSAEGVVPKEEFRLVKKIVEQASGYPMQAGASYEGVVLSHLYAICYPAGKDGLSLGWRVQISFHKGDCKVNVLDRIVKTPRLVDPCLGIIEEG
jgi:hypothetical protein